MLKSERSMVDSNRMETQTNNSTVYTNYLELTASARDAIKARFAAKKDEVKQASRVLAAWGKK